MTSLFSYLLTFFAIIFWAFRAIATLLFQLEVDFFTQPLNVTYEIMVLFATLPCLILVVKRNIVGAAAYLGLYVAYFVYCKCTFWNLCNCRSYIFKENRIIHIMLHITVWSSLCKMYFPSDKSVPAIIELVCMIQERPPVMIVERRKRLLPKPNCWMFWLRIWWKWKYN